MSIFQAVTMPQDKIVSNSDGSLKPAWLSYFGQIERMSAALDAYTPPVTPQKLAQVVKTETGAFASGTTILPYDDTIPQNTEGDQYLSLAITPTSATSTLVIHCVLNLSSSVVASNPLSMALFQDATANALAANSAMPTTIGFPSQCVMTHTMTSGTTSATTFKIRAGGAVAATTGLNGTAGIRRFGGVMASTLTITEVLA